MIQLLVKAVQLLTFCILCIKQEAEIIWSYIIFFYFGRTYARERDTYCLVIFLSQGLIPFHQKCIQLTECRIGITTQIVTL